MNEQTLYTTEIKFFRNVAGYMLNNSVRNPVTRSKLNLFNLYERKLCVIVKHYIEIMGIRVCSKIIYRSHGPNLYATATADGDVFNLNNNIKNNRYLEAASYF
jgi:hypothetical protein